MSPSPRLSAALPAVLLLLSSCDKALPPRALPRPRVRIEVARIERLEPQLAVSGVLAPLPGRDVKVGALVQGRLDKLLVAEGDPVKLGQLLAHIEAGPLQDGVSQAEARIEETKASLENASSRLARTERLFKDGIASKQELDDARAAVASAESASKQARALAGTAGLQLDRASLRAPISGVVAAILVPVGQPVDGNGAPLIEIADTRQLDLRAAIGAARAVDVQPGALAQVEVEGAGSVTGTVAAVAPLVDPATNTVLVRIRLENNSGRMRGGMFARGAILLPARTVLTIPKSALLPGEGAAATQVAVLSSTRAVSHATLQLGAEAGARVEVKGGLSAGAQVIVEGGYGLPDGTVVELLP